MGSVELFFNLGSQASKDDALWILENDTILSSQLIPNIDVVVELCRYKLSLWLGHPFRITAFRDCTIASLAVSSRISWICGSDTDQKFTEWILSTSWSAFPGWCSCGRYALESVSARYISGSGLYLISTSYCISLIIRQCKRFGAAAKGFLDNNLQWLVVFHQGNSSAVYMLMIMFHTEHLCKQFFLDLRVVLFSFR